MASQMQDFEGEFTCGICLEFYDTPVMLSCGHNFCKKCVQGIVDNNNIRDSYHNFIFLQQNIQCPLCQRRQDLRHSSVDQLPVNRTLENIINLYKTKSPIDIFDFVWNADMTIDYIQCQQHRLPKERYCEPCAVAICPKCEVLHHEVLKRKNKHIVKDLQDVAHHHQADIANILTEIKKKSLCLNEQIHLQADILSNVQEGQTLVEKELDQTFGHLMSTIRKKQHALQRHVTGELAKLKDPVENEQRKLKKLQAMLHELMKNLANIKKNKDMTHQIKKMKDVKKQLQSLLCFDFAWNLSERNITTIDLPKWNLIGLIETEAAIQGLHWEGSKPKCMDIGCQTDLRDSGKESFGILKSKHPIPDQVQTSTICFSTPLVNEIPQSSKVEKKKSAQNSAVGFMSRVLLHPEVSANSFTPSFSLPKNCSKNVSVPVNTTVAPSITAEWLGNQTQVAFPSAAIHNGISTAMMESFMPRAASQDSFPQTKAPDYIPTQNDIPTSSIQGFALTDCVLGGVSSSKLTSSVAVTPLASAGVATVRVSGVTPGGVPTVRVSGVTPGGVPTVRVSGVTPGGVPTTSFGVHMAAVSVTNNLPRTATVDGLLTHVTLDNSATAVLPGELPTTAAPVILPTTATPVILPTTATPVILPTTASPIILPTTTRTILPTTTIPFILPKTTTPTILPTTTTPFILPTTTTPFILPTTTTPVILPTTTTPVILPTTTAPFILPTTKTPVILPNASETYAVATGGQIPDISTQSNTYNSDIGTISGISALHITDGDPQYIKESEIPPKSPPFTFESYQQETQTYSNKEKLLREESCLSAQQQQINKVCSAGSNSGSLSTDSLTSSHINGSLSTDDTTRVSNKSVTADGASSRYVDVMCKSLDKSNMTQSLILSSDLEVSGADKNLILPSAAANNGSEAFAESLVTIDGGIKVFAVSSNLGNQNSALPGTIGKLCTHSAQIGAKPRPEKSSPKNQIEQNGCRASLTENQIAQQGASASQLSSINLYQSGEDNLYQSGEDNLYQSGEDNFMASALTSLMSDKAISRNGLTSQFESLNNSENRSEKRDPKSSLSEDSTTTEHQSSLKMEYGSESTFSKQPISVSLNFFSEEEGRKILKAKRKQAKNKPK